ncbi:MAG: Serine/threonine protein kinase PrkC, regulator of stationary phase [Myxococcales bacterium]|nr:Serine/threonine protein kinase PrkC, regulator of stationary phase [Myxococcales bacterium]
MDVLPEGASLDDKYRVIRHLSTGGMGAVYEVEHRGLGKRLAAKMLRPELARRADLLERFRREARAASAIGHENIIEVTDLGQTANKVPFLVMELLSGQTLAALCKSERRVEPARAVHIARQILSALHAAHERNIVHRDLKPENIFLIQRGGDPDFVKLLDFGIAKLLDEVDTLELTRDGQVVGTPTYMAPEQARGEKNVDGRVDLYAVGAILYRMVCGQRPYSAPNFNALLFAIAQGQPQRPRKLEPEVSPHLEAAILRAMAVDPRARFQTAAEFDEALDEDDRTHERSAAAVAKAGWAARRDEKTAAGDAPETASGGWQSRTLMGETPRPARISRAISTTTVVALAITLALALAGSAGLIMRRQARARAEADLQHEAADARARAVAAEARTMMLLTVAVDPPTAHLTVDGALVAGPVLRLHRDGARHTLRVEAEGYLPEDAPFLAASDQSLSIALKKKGRARPRGPADIIKPREDSGMDARQLELLQKMMKELGSEANGAAGALQTP